MSLDIYLYADVDLGGEERDKVYLPGCDFNITHNVTPMWRKAGCYDALYMSDGDIVGKHLKALKAARDDMEENLTEYRKLNPANGWGNADDALGWLDTWYKYCLQYPKAKIRVSK
jgi:hypothetical protein